MKLPSKLILFVAMSIPLLLSAQRVVSLSRVFYAGEAGYSCFRIPAIVRSPSGQLLAFAEGRVNGCGDFGDVDIVLKASNDGGKTWGELSVVAQYGKLQAGNPTPVFDLLDPSFPKGRLFLFYNTGNNAEYETRLGNGKREVWYVASVDEGSTWSDPVNITAMVHRPLPDPADWRSYANAPGHGIQLANARIFIPANHSGGPPKDSFLDYQAHAFYSDDHGKHFMLSPVVPYLGSNESTAVPLPNGGVLMSIRDQSGRTGRRLMAKTANSGEAWDSTWVCMQLPDPVCQGSLLDFKALDGSTILLHSNPYSSKERCCLTVNFSKDFGENWELLQEVYLGSAAYSDLVQVDSGVVGVLFEADNYGKILFGRFFY